MINVLFLIQVTDDDGDSADLFVMAPNEAEALAAWRKYYELTGKPDRLILVPVDAKPGAVAWDSIVQVVYDKQARKSACLTIEHDTKAREAIAAATVEPVAVESEPDVHLSECCHAEIGYDCWVDSNDSVVGGPYDASQCMGCGKADPEKWDGVESAEGEEGQDRESYSDTQDRDNYTSKEG